MDERQGVVFTGNLAWKRDSPPGEEGTWCGLQSLVLSLMSWFTHGKPPHSLPWWVTLKCCVQKSTKPRIDFTSAGHSGKGDFWEIRSCCSSQGILSWQREEREHNQKHRCTPQAVKFLLLLFNLGIFLQDQKIPIRMAPEGKATSLCSLSWLFPSLSTEKHLV